MKKDFFKVGVLNFRLPEVMSECAYHVMFILPTTRQ